MKTVRAFIGVVLILASGIASATVTDAEFQALKDQLSAVMKRLEDIQKEREQEKTQARNEAKAAPAPVSVDAASWLDRFALTGDFRFRHEGIDEEKKPYESRERIRARFGFTARATDTLAAGFILSTGGDNPISGNQTLDGGFSRKSIGLDQAYFDWAPLKGLHAIGGKFKTPFFRPGDSELIWDDDLRPEGLALTWDNGTWFGNGGVFFAKENGAATQDNPSANDILIYGAQAGGRLNFGDIGKLTAGVGYFNANSVKNMAALYDTEATIAAGKVFTSSTTFGNTYYVFTDSKGNQTKEYQYGYQELEGFLEFATKVASLPVKIFGDYVSNMAANGGGDTGFRTGLNVGEVKGFGTWSLGYFYEKLERDAVLGVFTDSDFGGGGTNVKGHVMTGTFGLNPRINIRARYYINDKSISSATPLDYNRLQLDLNVKY